MPATLAGHALAYAASGQSAADGRHAWLLPVLEISAAFLVALCIASVAGALLRAGIFVHTQAERSFAALWPRLGASQVLLFILMERAEGRGATILGCAIQLAIAIAVAWLLVLFAGLLAGCARFAQASCRYLERALRNAVSFVSRRPAPLAYALAVRAGTSRFQRPPP